MITTKLRILIYFIILLMITFVIIGNIYYLLIFSIPINSLQMISAVCMFLIFSSFLNDEITKIKHLKNKILKK